MNNNELNFSELLYLNAQKYAPNAGFLQNKEELPDGSKVQVVKLGNILAEAAFAYLYFNGHINIELQSKNILGIIPNKAAIVTRKSNGEGLSSLEKSIFNLADGTEAYMIMYRLIGDECSVPWSVVTGVVKESLVNKGYLNKEEIVKKIIVSFTTYKYHVNEANNRDYKSDLAEMNNKMEEFSNKDFYKKLCKSIESGIKAQQEKPDNDSD